MLSLSRCWLGLAWAVLPRRGGGARVARIVGWGTWPPTQQACGQLGVQQGLDRRARRGTSVRWTGSGRSDGGEAAALPLPHARGWAAAATAEQNCFRLLQLLKRQNSRVLGY